MTTDDPQATSRITYETHQRRAIEPDGTVHAARSAGDQKHLTLACLVSPLPTIERLVHDGDYYRVTCQKCRIALAIVITCPLCKTPGAEEFGLPIPGTDDAVDCARCTACGHRWGLDPGASAACAECGGSGHTGRGTLYDPLCTCHESNTEENTK
ncbi:hypothetical protein KN815_16120 [Streptomyces sp. 4503]|uniref:Uncharacterized protein n=1 Tax=Streptomyces niphimycinicus TaxID=2842201 RepID=A0ABS6CF47_9ACTN|nr:hypothetical protein [Streptomyces niphimycinicus]MBU3865548.1 hypothetical protein [Streptomyces niphimycinicus]